MKYTGNGLRYIFNPATKVIDFSGEPGFSWTNLFAIINLTAKQQIYGVGLTGYGASADASGKVLTLDYDTTSMGASDVLMFIQDEGNDNLADLLAAATGVSDPDADYVAPAGVVTRNYNQEDMMRMMLLEQRVTNFLLAHIGNIADDLEDIRSVFTVSDL
jgi:hypothetical protein